MFLPCSSRAPFARAFALALVLAILPALAAFAETLYLVRPHQGVFPVDTDNNAYGKKAPDKVLPTKNITWNITYNDPQGVGFFDTTEGAQRRARLEDALDYIAGVINETGTIDIEVDPSFFDTSEGLLAAAGTFWAGTPGFQPGTTLQRLQSGVKPFAGLPEISMIVNFGWDWNVTTNAPAPNEVDFLTVLVHEITHGLGFVGLADSSGQSEIGTNVYSRFDEFIFRGSNQRNLWSGSPPRFQGTPSDLVSNNLFFEGANAFEDYGQGVSPGIYAPNPYEPGSSISHWDTGNIVGGAIMEHALASGVARREYAPLEIGALIDIGYTNARSDEDNYILATNVSGDGTITRDPSQSTYAPGTVVTLTATPDTGWEFVEWLGNVSNPNSPTTTITMNQSETVTAVFQEESASGFRLIINITGEGSVSRNPDKPTYEAGEIVTLTATPSATHRFVQWQGDVANTANRTTTIAMNSDETITAVFEEIPATEALNITVVGSGTVQKTPDKPLYVPGETVQLSAQALPGWQFARWIGAVQNPNSTLTTVVVNATTTVIAIFVERDDLTLETNVVGQGAISKSPDQSSYTAGQRVNLQANPSPGWRFVNWDGPVNNRNATATFVIVNSDISVTARFEEAPTDLRLTITRRGEGAVTRTPDADFYTPDTRVVLVATPEPGWRFDGWDGNVAAPLAPTTEIVMQRDEEVIANFVPAQAQIVVEPAGTEFLFPPTEVSAASEAVFTVRNAGGGQLVGQADLDGGPFEFAGDPSYQLAPGESKQIVVRFVPTQPGDFTAILTFTGGEAGAVSITLTGSVAKVANSGCGSGGGSTGTLAGDAVVVLIAALSLALATRRRESAPQP